jgi:hypothetical protein
MIPRYVGSFARIAVSYVLSHIYKKAFLVVLLAQHSNGFVAAGVSRGNLVVGFSD